MRDRGEAEAKDGDIAAVDVVGDAAGRQVGGAKLLGGVAEDAHGGVDTLKIERVGGDELAADLNRALGDIALKVGFDGGAKVAITSEEGEADEGGDEEEPAEEAEVKGAMHAEERDED
jgi:hypothetical protein